MKRLLFLLVFFLSTKTNAQLITLEQAEAYSNKLVMSGFLTAKGKNLLFQEIKRGKIEVDHPSTVKSITYTSKELSKETILQFCSAAITTELMNRMSGDLWATEEKIFPKEPLDDSLARTYSLMDGFGGNKDYTGCITPQISTYGFTRMKTLNIFLNAGLIDEKVFNECQTALKLKKLRDEVQLLRYMVKRSTYYRYYDFNKKEQESYIVSLVKQGILTEEGKEALLKSYKDFELRSIPEILNQSPRYIPVDLSAYEPNPKLTYPIIFEAVKKLLPEFQYSNLVIQIIENKEDGLIRQDVKLSFAVDTLRYTHSFFHNYRKEEPSADDPKLEPSRVDQDFHKGINKWLTDIESSFRLYTINILDDDEKILGTKSVGLLLLKEGEDSIITSEVNLISRESFDQRLSKKNVRKFIRDLDQNGFFVHLTKSEMDTASLKIESSEINSLEDVLLQYPKTIVVFDWETANLENPYEQLTNEFMLVSRGTFSVSNVVDEFSKGWKNSRKVKYGFTMNGRRYEKKLKFEQDWLDPDFMKLIKDVLVEQKVNSSIYRFVDDGQVGGYIFLTLDQYKFIQKVYPDLLKSE